MYVLLYFCVFTSYANAYRSRDSLFFPNTNSESFYSKQSPLLMNGYYQEHHPVHYQHLYPPSTGHQLNYNQPQYQPYKQKSHPFDVLFEWRQIDYAFPSHRHREIAIARRNFIPENNLPLAIDRWHDRLFVTIPRWRVGTPATLSTIQLPSKDISPPLVPYPSWEWQADPESSNPDCSKLMSVYRIWVDECDRLWVLDSGAVNATIYMLNQVCPSKLVVFDLWTDRPIFSHELKASRVKELSIQSNIVVDIRNGRCSDAYAYIADPIHFDLTVFSMEKGRNWVTNNRFYFPNPIASDYNLNGINYQWTDGILGMSLSPLNRFGDRMLFFRSLSSFTEFMVTTTVLRNETAWDPPIINNGLGNAFVPIGDRGRRGQSSSSGISRENIQFFNLVEKSAIGCWNIEQAYNENTIDIVGQDNRTLEFPIEIKLDRENDQGLWVLSNRLPKFVFDKFDPNEVNIRILRASVREAVAGTSCDPARGFYS